MNDKSIHALAIIVGLSRWLALVAYAFSAWLVYSAIESRIVPTAPVASHDLGRNHLIAAGDIETPAISAMLGKYVKRKIDKNKPIEPDALADAPFPTPVATTMAAVVTISAQVRTSEKIEIGKDARICVNRKLFSGPNRVLSLECDEQFCSAVIELPKMPAQPVDPGALAGANLINQSPDCTTP